jgi:tetratricopeptide (TPR) repeat protein
MSSTGKPSKSKAAVVAKSAPIAAPDHQSQLDFELDFFETILARNPDFVDVLRVHGNNLTLKGRYGDGLKIDRRIVDLRPHDAQAHYNLACSYALLKKKDLALRMLRRAIELGYCDFNYMREDQDLEAIKDDPRFVQLLADFEAR